MLEPEVLVSYGRGTEGSFAAPAERASRNIEHTIKSDGRPPGATGSARAVTSLSGYVQQYVTYRLDDPFIASEDGPSTPRRVASQEAISESHSELEGARARLKPVDQRQGRGKGSSSNDATSTMAELGDMIDDALGEHEKLASPQESPIRVTKRPSLRSLGSPASLPSVELAQPRPRPFTIYRSRDNHVIQSVSSPPRGPLPLSLSGVLASPRSQSPGARSQHRFDIGPGLPSDRPSSPVKERAAIFENLAALQHDTPPPKSPAPKAHLHEKDLWHTIPPHNPTAEEEAILHRAKFGRSISERPQGVHDSSEETEQTFNTAVQSVEPSLPTGQSPPRSESHRAPSRGWPVQMHTSSKTGASEPQSFFEAASPSYRDAHNPPVRRNIVSQRIAQLALAGLEDMPAPKTRTASATQTDAESAEVRESELRDHNMDGGLLTSSHLPALQVPVQEEADDMLYMPGSTQSYGTVRNEPQEYSLSRNRHAPSRSTIEKQVIARQDPRGGWKEEDSPGTPRRGRSVLGRSPRGSGYGVAQSFYFSPRQSRSPSRGSGRRLTLEINMGTPDIQAMEKIVIKADMDVLEEA